MHLFDSSVPFANSATFKPADASVTDYRQLQQRLGLERSVIVQPSSYGVDHRVLVAGLRALGESARGVAVVTSDVDTEDLQTLAARGVVGARFNLVQRGLTRESMVNAVAAQAARLGWHLQFHLLPTDLLRLADELVALPVRVVLDHYGRAMTDPTLTSAVQSRLEQLLATGKFWLKLSAPYLASVNDGDFGSLQGFVERLTLRHADRLVWGTDWSHVTEVEKPDDAHLLHLLRRWIPVPEMQALVFEENASRLYGL
ncbi:MAG: amidohydrolase family protein [Burkholderiales bacterium]|nr:amidohydrolase family protein [Burkholderiales bacterium]